MEGTDQVRELAHFFNPHHLGVDFFMPKGI